MKTYEQIYSEMKQALERKTGLVISEGGDLSLRLSAVAAELESLWNQTEWTKNQCFPQLAGGEYLDRHAELRTLTRGEATAAVGVMRFETDAAREQDTPIPEGTVCLNAAGTEFITDGAAAIPAGELFCTATARARDTGAAGNVPSESIVFMAVAPAGVTRCFNPAAFAGGGDGESDGELRARVLESFRSLPNGSNRAYYEAAAIETQGVAAATVIPRARGIGTVDVYIASPAGLPENSTVQAVVQKLQAQREICVDVQVFAPTAVSVPLTLSLETEDDADFEELSQRVRAALEGYFDGRLLGKDVLLAKLGSIVFGVEGVKNYSFTAPAADLTIALGELPVAGTITISEG